MDKTSFPKRQKVTFLTKNALWANFDLSKTLQPSKIKEVKYDKISYTEYFFSGRDVGGERVRIYGIYATPLEQKSYNAILYLPDVTESPDFDMIIEYAKMGYAVLAVDLCGKSPTSKYCTTYPQSVSYANYYNRGRRMDFVDDDAYKTCWYEWVAIGRYAISFLQSQPHVKNVGVIGARYGANVAWQLSAIDDRIKCSVMMFGAGWHAYKNHFKYDDSSKELVFDEERRRFVAAIDAHAYAQDAKCPILYLSSTNNEDFDFDRSFDTMLRVPKETDCFFNYATGYNEYLDNYCKKDVDLFLKKYLSGKEVYFPKRPTLDVEQDGRYLNITIHPDREDDVLECKVFLNEGVVDPALRNWMPCELVGDEGFDFEYVLSGATSKVFVFTTVRYKSGVTVASKLTCKQTTQTQSKRSGVIYTSKDGLEGITFYDKNSTRESYFVGTDQFIQLVKGAGDIYGAYSACGLISYRLGEPSCHIDRNSIISMDVFTSEFCVLRLVLMQKFASGTVEYSFTTEFKANVAWKSLTVGVDVFKTEDGRSVKDFDGVYALRIEGEGKYAVNNILLI